MQVAERPSVHLQLIRAQSEIARLQHELWLANQRTNVMRARLNRYEPEPEEEISTFGT